MTHPIAALSLTALVFCMTFPAMAQAEDLPALRKGMWEYKRTLVGQGAGGKDAELNVKKCADPWASMKAMNELTAKQGCKTTAAPMKGNVRTSITECTAQGTAARTESVMTIANDSAYTVNVTTTGGGKTNKEILVAKRIGDC